MQKALALQAEARRKSRNLRPSSPVRASRCTTPADDAPEGRGGRSNGRVRAMSAYQANVKVEQLAEGGQARTPGSIVASSTTSIKIAEKAPPAPCSRMGGHAQNEGTPTTSAVHAFGNEHSGASLNAKGAALGRCDSEPKLVRAQRLAADIPKRR